ncbi:MAG: aspartyl/asparaginyl beta-hydroxylase domain-containing protein [Sphingorhabdus sp.]
MRDHPPVPLPKLSDTDADARLQQNHFDLEAMLAKADGRFHMGDHKTAASFYRAIARLIDQRGAASDAELLAASRCSQMSEWFDIRFKDHLLASLEQGGFGHGTRHPRFQKSLEMMLGERERPLEYRRYPQTPLVHYYPDLPYVSFADPAEFDWVAGLEACFPAMREEAAKLLAEHADFRPYVQRDLLRPQGDVHGMLENADWSTLFLWENGAAIKEHVAHCPEIFDAVMRHVPLCHIGRRSPSVMLSLLRPGAHIPPHTGMINCRYICHLPLIVPSECGFRVGDTIIEWQEGKVILFDDTVQHEAWNRSQSNRLVLIFDIWRPELDENEQAQIRALFAAVDSY